MSNQRTGTRPTVLQQQCAAGWTFDGTVPSSDTPAFDANGALVWPEETAADGSGLFDFQSRRGVKVSSVRINVPSGDVAGFNLYITDGTVDTEVAASTDTETSYFVTDDIILGRGEDLKLIMAGSSAGLIRATVIAAEINDAGDI